MCRDSLSTEVEEGQESHDLLVHKANFPDDLGFSSLTNRGQRKISKAELEYFQQFLKQIHTLST